MEGPRPLSAEAPPPGLVNLGCGPVLARTVLEALSVKPFSIVGHRGAKGLAPENTLAALEKAVEAGADVAEFDVQSTRDGVLVASHDPVIAVDEGVKVNVREVDYEQLSRYHVGGERIPRIEEILEAARGRLALFLEVKEVADAEPLARLLSARGACSYAAVISFEEEAVKRAMRVCPGLAAGLVYFRPPGKILDCKRLGCKIVLPRYPLATVKAVALAHRLGLRVVAWTVNSEEWALKLVERGVDAIATDYPDRLALLRRRLAGGGTP